MPLGDMITIAQFAFCEEHGLEFCTRCFCDYRMMNNVLVEEYVEQYSDEDMRIEALEALGDDRPSLSILRVGEPSKAVNSKGVRIYRCFQHRTRDCNDLDDQASDQEEAVDDSSDDHDRNPSLHETVAGTRAAPNEDLPPPLIDLHISNPPIVTTQSTAPATASIPIQHAATGSSPPHSSTSSRLLENPLFRSVEDIPLFPRGPRTNSLRRPLNQRPSRPEVVASMTRPDCPRRFVPPTPTTQPQDLFKEREDFSANAFKRLFHKQDDATMLVYTDGACLDQGRPVKANVAAQVVHSWTVNGPEQTSNRAELRAILLFLQMRVWEAGGADRFVVATDSEYVVEGICSRVKAWTARGWKTVNGNTVANRDLWEALLNEVECREALGYRVLFWRIDRNHNRRADEAAKRAAADDEHRDVKLNVTLGVMISLRLLRESVGSSVSLPLV